MPNYPTAEETAERLEKVLGEKNIRRISFAPVYKAAERQQLRDVFLSNLAIEARERGFIIGYGYHSVILAKDKPAK